MRHVRTSRTFDAQFADLLEFGERAFGERVIANKRRTVYRSLELLASYPALKQPDPDHGLYAYQIRHTPFVVLYDFDDEEIRVHFIFHAHADLSDLDPTAAVW